MFVRRDIPVEQQIVQAGHAALEAGIYLGDRNQSEPSSLVVIGVKNQYQLEKAIKDLETKGIKTISFFEPSWDYGLTAFGTEPLTQDQRILLRRYQLWRS